MDSNPYEPPQITPQPPLPSPLDVPPRRDAHAEKAAAVVLFLFGGLVSLLVFDVCTNFWLQWRAPNSRFRLHWGDAFGLVISLAFLAGIFTLAVSLWRKSRPATDRS
jgi:hypothetical protein